MSSSAIYRLLKQHISLAPVSGYVVPITPEQHLGLDVSTTNVIAQP